MPDFVPGLRLSERFYREAVAPILARAVPGLPYSAALLGSGSEVLGFDDVRSTDHEWGPRLLLFLAPAEHAAVAPAIGALLRNQLPHDFLGYPTGFGPPDEEGIRAMVPANGGPVAHKIEITTLPRVLRDLLGLDHYDNLSPLDWLLCSEQRLLEFTSGGLFHDGLGTLAAARANLAYFPSDVWRYVMAAQWTRIAQQEAFVGRTGEVGDDLGSRLVAAALVRDLMRLGFLLERRYAPYPKWLGTAFGRLTIAPRLQPSLAATLAAATWRERERHLADAYRLVAGRHNELGLTEPLPTEVSLYHGRPFIVIWGGRFAAALRAGIDDERVRALPPGLGAIDQISDATDLLAQTERRRRLGTLFGA